MPNPAMSEELMLSAVRAVREAGSITAAAKALGIPRQTLQSRLRKAAKSFDIDTVVIEPAVEAPVELLPDQRLRQQLKVLESQLRTIQSQRLSEDYVKSVILELKSQGPDVPEWVAEPAALYEGAGVPTLFASDFHWGEVVDGNQIGGVNEFNLPIAHERLRTMVEVAINLLKNHLRSDGGYPGIVFVLGGDMVSGDIHDELVATNEKEIMAVVVDLWGALVWAIDRLLEAFGKVFLPCVSGNHGRNTHKIRAKGRNFTSFDWLLYQFLAKHYEGNPSVKFLIPDGPDAYYSVLGHRYLLTHGDQFRGGDGMIGALGPLIRGDHKKRSRNAQISRPYDTMICGHWHQLIQLERLIVNGCFPAGSQVVSEGRTLPIEEARIGDKVLSRDGSLQEVTHVFHKTSDRLIGVKVRGLPEVVRSTPNHLIWAVKAASYSSAVSPGRRSLIDAEYGPAQWIPMDFLSPGDYVHVPFPRGDDRPVDAETAWAYGLYLAEGSTLLDGGASKKHNRICLTMHERELPVLERFAAWFFSAYGVTPRTHIRTKKDGGKTSELVVSPGRSLCAKFRELFGHLATNKRLPPGALRWADDLKASLLQGWVDGDGHSAVQPDCRPTVSATTVSPELAWGMFQIAPSSGVWPSMSKLCRGGPRKSDSYTVHMNTGQNVAVVDGEAFYRIAERFESADRVPVFDLEVSGEHTYCVGGVGVHNSLKGYDEYAYANNFGFEPARQALWITHANHGITFAAPVNVDRRRESRKLAPTEWVAWKD